jgi:phosphoribosylglycinamide formyltransferase 1
MSSPHAGAGASPLALGVLCSGAGTNLGAILDACAGGLRAEVRVVISNKPGVKALERAEIAGIPAVVLSHGGYPDRAAYDRALADRLQQHGVSLVVLAGFMRLLSPVFLQEFPDRVLNLHPSLLPAFPGIDAQQQALDHGVAVTGCTVHLVDAGTDTGPIVAQHAVPVLEGDTRESLALRIRDAEHRTLVEAIRWFAEGRIHVVREGEHRRPRVLVDGVGRALLSGGT